MVLATRPLLQLFGSFACITLLLLYLRYDGDKIYGLLPSEYSDSDATKHFCALDSDLIARLNLQGNPIKYARLDVGVSYSRSTKDIDSSLGIALPDFYELDESGHAMGPEGVRVCSESVHLKSPNPSSPPDASHVLFGVATDLDRLNESLPAFASWASGTGTIIHALIQPAPNSYIESVQNAAKELGLKVYITVSSEDFHDRYFFLLKLLYVSRKPETEWVSIIDDDTFFPSMSSLLQRLDRYDSSKPQYVGGLCEDLRQIPNYGIMAYGGGGVFLSMPLLLQLQPHWYACNVSTKDAGGGDGRIAACIYEHTTTKLSWEPDFHQTDLQGDVSGFYESGRPTPLSVHHWKSWNQVDVVGMSAVSKVCGDGCLLRKLRFSDEWFLVNGFSVIRYSDGYLDEDEDGVMEETWSDGGDYRHTLFPLKPKDGGKISYRFELAVEEEGHVRQYYIRRSEVGNMVLEVDWHPE